MQLNFEQYGDRGKPLILLHGLLGSSDNWRTMGRRFAEEFRVYAVDLRNHGSSPHSDLMNYDVMAEDILEFIRDHNLSPSHILGHSLGGKVAMQVALTYPAEVDKLVVVDVAPKEYPPSHEPILDALAGLDLEAVASRQDADEALSASIPEQPIRQFLLKNLERQETGAHEWQMNLGGLRRNYHRLTANVDHESYTAFTRPTLFIRGDQSDYIAPDEDEDVMLELFPRAEIVTISGAGHWIHAEAPDAFAEAVFQFLT